MEKSANSLHNMGTGRTKTIENVRAFEKHKADVKTCLIETNARCESLVKKRESLREDTKEGIENAKAKGKTEIAQLKASIQLAKVQTSTLKSEVQEKVEAGNQLRQICDELMPRKK